MLLLLLSIVGCGIVVVDVVIVSVFDFAPLLACSCTFCRLHSCQILLPLVASIFPAHGVKWLLLLHVAASSTVVSFLSFSLYRFCLCCPRCSLFFFCCCRFFCCLCSGSR